jgi:protein dithiol oxidoreductase (disulfide-forming)
MVLGVPQRQETNGKIEVIEFFSWGCPHCYEFYPLLASWTAALPKDATFRRVPVGLGHPEWDNLARAYYALQSTGDVARLDSQIFEAIHKEHVSLFDEPSITEWVGKHGVNVAKFRDAYRSFGVNTSVGQAEDAAVGYRVAGIPTIALAGKYTVTGDHKLDARHGEGAADANRRAPVTSTRHARRGTAGGSNDAECPVNIRRAVPAFEISGGDSRTA